MTVKKILHLFNQQLLYIQERVFLLALTQCYSPSSQFLVLSVLSQHSVTIHSAEPRRAEDVLAKCETP